MKAVCVFTGSRAGNRPEYREAARALGEEIARRGMRLIFGGGQVGMMGALADAALAGGGEVTGVIPRALQKKEVVHEGVRDMEVVETMFERKERMFDLSDGFIVLPGGMGTFDEALEAITLAQLSFHHKPIGFLNVADYFAPFFAAMERAAGEGFMDGKYLALWTVETDPAALLDRMAAV
ncbi:MAG: TIGR00730 family Rossman fold protein [bacterium]|nr:TIGR00730 family Rossman fold protein [bacterium]